MTDRVDARDVLDANATTSRAFSGRVVGVFRRSGPNAWDDYLLVEVDGEPIDVLAGIPIQLEPEGVVFRMRRKSEVLLVAWTPGAADEVDLRARFLEECVQRARPSLEGNLARWVHGQLDDKPKLND